MHRLRVALAAWASSERALVVTALRINFGLLGVEVADLDREDLDREVGSDLSERDWILVPKASKGLSQHFRRSVPRNKWLRPQRPLQRLNRVSS